MKKPCSISLLIYRTERSGIGTCRLFYVRVYQPLSSDRATCTQILLISGSDVGSLNLKHEHCVGCNAGLLVAVDSIGKIAGDIEHIL